ncbi:MAG: TM0106 family RecB-like putative nuclease, partial [Actinobacteria bacterium]
LLRSEGREVIEIAGDHRSLAGLRRAAADTEAALRAGAELVYQATFFDGRWLGHADFLRRVDTPTDLGPFGYEVLDTKLARRVKAAALLQTAAYSAQLAGVQGVAPERMHVVLGDRSEESYLVREFAAYHRMIQRRLEDAAMGEPLATYPDPVEHCGVCRWAEVCDSRRRADDHLSLVAGMRRDQTRKLAAAGIETVAALARTDVDDRVPGVSAPSLDRLTHQAELQIRQRTTGQVHYELLAPDGPGRGLGALPPPSAGDLFFDIEGDPFAEGDGLEYLFGVVELVEGAPRYHAFWAHSRADEKRAFEQLVDFFVARLDRRPDLHVYHYAPYEPTALKRLMGRHGTREDEVDRLLRGQVLVDLYQVVRQGVRVSQESYSIKKLEPLYAPAREGPIADGGSSIVAYEGWLESGDAQVLEALAAYNEADCVSAWRLRDWLEARRDELEARLGEAPPRPEPPDTAEGSEQLAVALAETEALVHRLTAGIPDDPAARSPDEHARWLLAQLLNWHRREAKPEWWAYYHRLALNDEELADDPDAIGGLVYEGVVNRVKRSLVHRYRFDPSQEHKIAAGTRPLDPRTEEPAGLLAHIEAAEGVLHLMRGERSDAPHPTSVVPPKPIDTGVQRRALARLAQWVLDHGIATPAGEHSAARDLLLSMPPRVQGHMGGALTRPGESDLDAARRLALSLDGGCLPVQGPPGSGKTWIGARMIVELVRAGRRVGISATSHRAIGNLLDEVCRYAADAGVEVRALQKANEHERCSSPCVRFADSNAVVDEALAGGAVDVVAGTPWLFAREQLDGAFDVLFVDEAGQMSLANALAVAGSARNLVLLGDPQQLAQPSKGTHPPGADRSALEHLLGEHATIPADRGLFLRTTWRLHPLVCGFVSEAFYEGRLTADPSCARQDVDGPLPLGGAGLRHLPVPHRGNRSCSPEEAGVVADAVADLLGRPWTGCRGDTRPLALGDVLVVAPYNAQVAELARQLPAGARVGTVDKFQGQEGAVVVFSMATSGADDLPRTVEFLYSLNRLNVAVSRARALAVLVASPALLQLRCRTPGQMRLANALCRLVEIAQEQLQPVPA